VNADDVRIERRPLETRRKQLRVRDVARLTSARSAGSLYVGLESSRRCVVKLRVSVLLLFVGLLSLPVSLSAHHSWPVSRSKLVTVKGTVTAVSWMNPHPMISLDVPTADGNVERWSVGGPAITQMERNGWSKTTLKVGDLITGIGYQFGDGQKIIRLEKVVFADGKELLVYGR
jgi:Family of unknown function (DUF6152)